MPEGIFDPDLPRQTVEHIAAEEGRVTQSQHEALASSSNEIRTRSMKSLTGDHTGLTPEDLEEIRTEMIKLGIDEKLVDDALFAEAIKRKPR